MDIVTGFAPVSSVLPIWVLLIFPICPSVSTMERCGVSGEGLMRDDICFISSYMNATGFSDDVISAKDIQFNLRDSSNGILEVKFPILKRYVTYELRLNVMEQAKTQEECNMFVHLKNYTLHSTRLFDIFSCKDDLNLENCDTAPSCTKFTSVTFSHVFGGCYYLHITPKNNGSSGQPTTRHIMIDSDHKKTLIWNMVPSIADQSYPDDHMARITFAYALLRELPVSLTLVQGVNLQQAQACSKTGHKHSCCHLDNNTRLLCETINDGNFHPYCELMTGQTNSVNSVACTFYNMTPGQYCVILEPIERDRCSPGTVWTPGLKTISPCKYQYNFTFMKRGQLNQTEVRVGSSHSTSNILIVVGSLGALAAFVLLGIAMYNALHHPRKPQPSIIDPQFPEFLNHRHILLLYAQDCQPFMKLMSTFRSLLSNVGNCEVLDCFDPACSEMVALAPEVWMHRAVTQCRVVVVVSDCAAELQRRSSMQQQYRYPQPYSHLFLVGLREITSSQSAHEYCRVFVVRFDSQDVTSVTPFRRFLLPSDLHVLLRDLNLSGDTRILEEYKHDQKLKDNIDEFLCYKREHPNYVNSLLMLEHIV